MAVQIRPIEYTSLFKPYLKKQVRKTVTQSVQKICHHWVGSLWKSWIAVVYSVQVDNAPERKISASLICDVIIDSQNGNDNAGVVLAIRNSNQRKTVKFSLFTYN